MGVAESGNALWGISGSAKQRLGVNSTEAFPASAPDLPQGNSSARQFDFTVRGESPWSDTGIDITPGDKLQIDVRPKFLETSSRREVLCDPEGKVRIWSDIFLALPLTTSGEDALIGRIGQTEAVPFLVGAHREFTATQSGRLFLGINEMTRTIAIADLIQGSGSFIRPRREQQRYTATRSKSSALF